MLDKYFKIKPKINLPSWAGGTVSCMLLKLLSRGSTAIIILSDGSNFASKTRLLLLLELLLFRWLAELVRLLLFVTLKILAVLVVEAVDNPVTTVARAFDTKLALPIGLVHLNF